MTQRVAPKRKVMFCSKHPTKELDLYCETCEELVCRDCTVRIHRDHQYDLVTDAFQKHKDVLVASVQPVEQQLETVMKSLQRLDTQCQKITDQRETLVGNIHKTIRQLQEALEVRKTELIGQLDQITQQKLKILAAQKDQIELVQAQLSSCLNFVKESLRTGSEGEILAMKKPVVKQVEEITAEFKAEILVRQERSDIRFSAAGTPELTQTCQQFGKVYSCPAFPEKCYATGKGLEVATIRELATIILHAVEADGKECEQPLVNTSCELVSDAGGSTVKGAVQKKEKNKYTISYQPTHRGRHQLHVKVEGVPIRESPFVVVARLPIQNLGTPIKTIGGLNRPWGVAVNQRGEVIVAEYGGDCISIFSPSGEKIRTFGSKGSAQGQFKWPRGVAVDGDGNILVVDNHRIQKFTGDGKFITAVDRKGNKQFSSPTGVTINHRNRRVYICDQSNHRIQILNADLTFSDSFGSCGRGDGQFTYPWGIALDSTGNVYVADTSGHRIQVFTAEGKFLRKFGKSGSGSGELKFPSSVSIDSDNIVYVTEDDNHCVSMFTSEGQFLRSFGTKGEGPGQFNYPRGIAVDRDGLVYVSDTYNNRIQIF